MDPHATIAEFLRAIAERDTDAMREHAANLADWLDNGGYAPDVAPLVRALFNG